MANKNTSSDVTPLDLFWLVPVTCIFFVGLFVCVGTAFRWVSDLEWPSKVEPYELYDVTHGSGGTVFRKTHCGIYIDGVKYEFACPTPE